MNANELRAKRAEHLSALEAIVAKESRSAKDNEEFATREQAVSEIDRHLAKAGAYTTVGTPERARDGSEVNGRPDEQLNLRDQSMVDYVQRASENGVSIAVNGDGRPGQKMRYHDQEFRNQWCAAQLGIARESRALLEDTANSGLAVTPQSWSGAVIDYLYPNSIFGRLGCSVTPMSTEIVNVPQFAEPPAFVASSEGQPVGIDNSAAFEQGYILNASGSYRNLLTVSRELAQDAFVNGSLDSYLAQQVGKSLALTVDQAMLFGTSLTGCPGLVNETGFNVVTPVGYTSGAYTLTDTTQYSVLAEKVRNKNVEPSAFLENVSVNETVGRLAANTYAKFWDMPSTVANIPHVTTANTAILPTTETDGLTPALTGGSSSSIYTGPWSMVNMGVRLDSVTMRLEERFAEFGLIGFAVFCRFSIRTGHPEVFYRCSSIATS